MRVELGVDGNAGFALLGEDLQSGEAEFVTIDCDSPCGSLPWNQAAERAANAAYRALTARLGKRVPYFLGPSHPRAT
jgi:hypothetical protein